MASEETARLLASGIAKYELSRLPWSKAQIQLRDRVGFLRADGEDEWPDLTDETLAKTATEWLAPFLVGKTKLSEIGADDLGAALDVLLPWNLKRRLEEQAPTHSRRLRAIVTPSITRRKAHPPCTSACRSCLG